jgi:hypothetical protein
MNETQAQELKTRIDDAELENLSHDTDYWCDTYVSRMIMTDGTELDNDTLELFLETSVGIDWMHDQIVANLY